MNKKIKLETDRLLIRTLQLSDITDEYIDGLNDPLVNKFLVNARLTKQTKETIGEFITQNLKSKQDILMGVFLKEGDTLIGTIRISGISEFHYLCNIGICFFNRSYWGKGYAVEALKRTVEFAFCKLNMHYIEAGVYTENAASIKLFERAGFSAQSVYKDKFRYDSGFKEVKIFGKTNNDFDHDLLGKI